MTTFSRPRQGKLLPLFRLPRTRPNQQPTWQVRCDCGRALKMREQALDKGAMDCGKCNIPLTTGRNTNLGAGGLSGDFFGELQRSAGRRGKSFTVTAIDLWEQYQKQKGKCSLTGDTLHLGAGRKVRPTGSVDRIDSTRGYEKGNITWVHKRINIMKGELTLEEFVSWCRKVARHHERRGGEDGEPEVDTQGGSRPGGAQEAPER